MPMQPLAFRRGVAAKGPVPPLWINQYESGEAAGPMSSVRAESESEAAGMICPTENSK
jgi:hypothetical protein